MPIQTTQTLEYKITKFTVDVENTNLVIVLSYGYTAADGVFRRVSNNEQIVNVPTADAVTLFQTLGDSALPVYETVKSALYQYLINTNVVAGTIN